MQKYIKKIVVCLVIYVVFLFIFSWGIKGKNNEVEVIEDLSDSSFPVVYIQSGENMINLMHGYMSNLNARYVRDGIAPIVSDNKCNFCIKEYDREIKKVSYEISDTSGSQIVDAGTVKSFDNKDDYKTFSISLHEQLSPDTEYVLKMVLLTENADKIYYYTRIKKTNAEGMEQILNFAKSFHEKTITKSDKETVQGYLETDASKMKGNDFSYVNINSDIEMINFGTLEMEMISDIYTTIREVEASTAVVELSYYAKAKNGDKEEKYKIDEGYRIRWTEDRTFLLFFERNMEEMFNPECFDTSTGEFEVGITSGKDIEIMTTSDNSKTGFVRNGELWAYDNPKNKLTKVFSFEKEDDFDIRNAYDEHGIKIVNISDDGDIYFMVYGYMNRGDYEGQTCIVLYKFYEGEGRVEELTNIPVSVTYGMLKEQLTDFYFVNDDNVFFFNLANKIYMYDIEENDLQIIAEDVLVKDITMSKEGKYIAWQTKKDDYSKITVMDLENKKKNEIVAENGKCVKVLGNMNKSLIYGIADKSKVSELVDGTQVVPTDIVNISKKDGEVVKEYKTEQGYVINIETEGNKIVLKKVRASGDGKFIEMKDDCIFNKTEEIKEGVELKNKENDTTKKEWYISLPKNVKVEKEPQIKKTKFTAVKNDTFVRIDEDIMSEKHYYVYACHGLESGYDTAKEAIEKADSRMGMVTDNEGYIVWERGLAGYASTIKDIEFVETNSDLDSVKACIKTMILESGANVSDSDLAKEKGAITDILNKYLKGTSVNLTGTDIKNLQYLLTKKKPVLAMINSSEAVLLTEFDKDTVSYFDSSNGSTTKISYDEAESKFAEVGYVYIGSLE